MTREQALSQVAPNLSYFNDCKPEFAISQCKLWINKIFDEHDAQLKGLKKIIQNQSDLLEMYSVDNEVPNNAYLVKTA